MINMFLYLDLRVVFQVLLLSVQSSWVHNWMWSRTCRILCAGKRVKRGCNWDCFQFIWPKLKDGYFWEIASYVVLVVLDFAKYIEQENAHILVQIFVVQEELWEEGQIFTVDRVFIAVNLKHCYIVFLISIYLIPWRVKKWAYLGVPFELDLKCEETKAKIADIEAVKVVIVDGIWREVPGISGVLSELEFENCFKLGDFLMC